MTIGYEAPPPPQRFPCGCVLIPLVDETEPVVGIVVCWDGCATAGLLIVECIEAGVNLQRVTW